MSDSPPARRYAGTSRPLSAAPGAHAASAAKRLGGFAAGASGEAACVPTSSITSSDLIFFFGGDSAAIGGTRGGIDSHGISKALFERDGYGFELADLLIQSGIDAPIDERVIILQVRLRSQATAAGASTNGLSDGFFEFFLPVKQYTAFLHTLPLQE